MAGLGPIRAGSAGGQHQEHDHQGDPNRQPKPVDVVGHLEVEVMGDMCSPWRRARFDALRSLGERSIRRPE